MEKNEFSIALAPVLLWIIALGVINMQGPTWAWVFNTVLWGGIGLTALALILVIVAGIIAVISTS